MLCSLGVAALSDRLADANKFVESTGQSPQRAPRDPGIQRLVCLAGSLGCPCPFGRQVAVEVMMRQAIW